MCGMMGDSIAGVEHMNDAVRALTMRVDRLLKLLRARPYAQSFQ
jgi:hypothetical protein